jgi:RNA polymerase sigma factor (sigma-70 family)
MMGGRLPATGAIDMMLDQMAHRVRQAALKHRGMTDGELLESFIVRRDEPAFATLVHRHGAMVLGVCRRVVRHVQDAEDAFQATFVILVRKAASVVPREAVGNWLYGVAYRTALEARTRNGKRRARETQVHDMPEPIREPNQLWHDLRPLLDRELSQLPAKYRLPVVLCDLEGQARHEVSRQLQVPEGTLSSRLARGRKLLAGRLARRGITLSAGTLALALASSASTAAPPALVTSTIEAATLCAAGPAAMGALAPSVAALVKGVLNAMLISKLKTGAIALMLVALFGTGGGVVAQRLLAGPPRSEPVVKDRTEATASQGREQAPRRGADFTGKIVGISKDNKTLTLEVAPAGRGEPGRTAEVKLTANTKLLFSGVGLGGAKLTEGYVAAVWTADGAKDSADHIQLMGNVSLRQPANLAGAVVGVAKDGKTLTFQVTPRGRDDLGKTVDVRLSDKAQVTYSNIGKGGARPTEGYHAEVWFKEDAKDTVAKAVFNGSAVTFERGVQEPRVDVMGKVAGVAADGKSLTLSIAPRERGEEPGKVDIKLDDKTDTAYFQVGPDGARPTEGHVARVWLADGSKDTAGKIFFQGVPKESPILRGKVTAIGKDGKSITLETRPKERGEAPATVEVKLGPKTKLVFQGVGPDGALLTEGYVAQVMLAEGSPDTATHIVLGPAPATGERNRE